MTDLPSLRSLYDRVCKADGPDPEIDCRIHWLVRGERHWATIEPLDDECQPCSWARRAREMNASPVTGSLDAIDALVRQELPGWTICFEAKDGVAEDCYLIGPHYDDSRPEAESSKPVGGMPTALALTAAFLAACIAKREAENAD